MAASSTQCHHHSSDFRNGNGYTWENHGTSFPLCFHPRAALGHSLVPARQPPGRSCPPPAALCLDLDEIKHHPCGTEKEKQTKSKENGDRKKKVNRACMPTFPLPETGPGSCGRTVSEAINHLLLPKPVFVPPNLSAAPSPGQPGLLLLRGVQGSPPREAGWDFAWHTNNLAEFLLLCRAWAQPRWRFVGKHGLTAAQRRRRRHSAGAQHLCRSACTRAQKQDACLQAAM